MREKTLELMRQLAPDLTEEIGRRARMIEKIAALQPVGRRQLAALLHLPEREVRNTAALLRDMGYVELNTSGMTLSPRAFEMLEDVRELSRQMGGMETLERRLESLLPVDRVLIAPGNADEEPQVLSEVGRLCAGRLRSILKGGNTLAVTGGRTVAAVAHGLTGAHGLNVMVVPARGGIGHSVEWQANTLAEEIAGRLGGHYRLIHLPDLMEAPAMEELLKLPEIREVMELLQRADVILHGIARADGAMKDRGLSRQTQMKLTADGARGECFGAFFTLEGKSLLQSSRIGVDLGRLKPTCRMVAAAAGASKAEAILSVLRYRRHALLVTDEAAAEGILGLVTQ